MAPREVDADSLAPGRRERADRRGLTSLLFGNDRIGVWAPVFLNADKDRATQDDAGACRSRVTIQHDEQVYSSIVWMESGFKAFEHQRISLAQTWQGWFMAIASFS